MVLKITPKFNAEQIRKMLERKLTSINDLYYRRLQSIGEEFVKNAREHADFTDRTGNLRSSIGYVIMKDGKQLIGNFKVSGNGTAGADGMTKSRAKAVEIAAGFPKGYALICVAGMEYAAAVESKGKDVISSSSIIAKKALIKAIENIHKLINAA